MHHDRRRPCWLAGSDPGGEREAACGERRFTVLALDRPGYGRSSGSLPQGQRLSEQAGTVYGALDDFAARHATGAGVFVVGHSFGLKLGLFLAAHPRGKELLGVDGSGAAYRYEPALHPVAAQAELGADGSVAGYASRSPREPRCRGWSCDGSPRPATTSAWGGPRVPTI